MLVTLGRKELIPAFQIIKYQTQLFSMTQDSDNVAPPVNYIYNNLIVISNQIPETYFVSFFWVNGLLF